VQALGPVAGAVLVEQVLVPEEALVPAWEAVPSMARQECSGLSGFGLNPADLLVIRRLGSVLQLSL
jgi:hypothetical protein